jgi:hypothetical protein
LADLGSKALKALTLHAPGAGPAWTESTLGGIRLGLFVLKRRQAKLSSLIRGHLSLVGGAKDPLDGLDDLAVSVKAVGVVGR